MSNKNKGKKKTGLLNEQWLKLAGIPNISNLKERYYDRDLDEPSALEENEEEMTEEQDNEVDDLEDEEDLGMGDELEGGDEVDDYEANLGGDVDVGGEEVDVPEAEVAKIVDAIANALSSVTGVDVDVEAGEGEEEMPAEEPEMSAEEPELDVGGEESEEEPPMEEHAEYEGGVPPDGGQALHSKGGNSEDAWKGNNNGGDNLKNAPDSKKHIQQMEEQKVEEMTDALVEVVYKRVVSRLQETAKQKKEAKNKKK